MPNKFGVIYMWPRITEKVILVGSILLILVVLLMFIYGSYGESDIFSIIPIIASTSLVIVTIWLKGKEVGLIDKKREEIDAATEKFDDLIYMVDRKVSAYFNLVSKSNVATSLRYGGTFNEEALYDAINPNVLSKSNTSLFTYRMGHYSAEKEIICKKFLDFMLNPKNDFAKKIKMENYDKIYLLIDSGSTTYPIFKLLCDYHGRGDYNDILSKVEIFTNNIPGIEALLKYGRKGNDITSGMIYDCNTIPGRIEGQYSAILGIEGINYLNDLKKKLEENKKEKALFISLITGNYITIREGVLWRGKYHGAIKNAYIKNSNYIFILSPLGKIFKIQLSKLNDIIKNTNVPLASFKKYNSLKSSDRAEEDDDNTDPGPTEKLVPDELIELDSPPKEVYLVTTKRTAKQNSCYPPEFLNYFNKVYLRLCSKLGEDHVISEDFSPDIDSDDVIHQLHIYDKQYKEAFFNYEFPHPEIRNYMKGKMEEL